jgi:Ca2+-binding RTX toxin-like protein
MATYVFDGTENLSIADFDPADDTIVIEGFDAADVASLSRTSTNFSLALDSGVVLSLSGNLSALATADFIIGDNTDVEIAIGTSGADNGVDTLNGNVVVGGQGDDSITASTADAILYGNQDNDSIDGGGFDDLRIFGGAGTDSVTVTGSAGTVVYGGLGSDTITAVNSAADEGVTIYGGNGGSDGEDSGDRITGGAGDDLIYGNAGDDTIVGGDGDNTILGGQGSDDITSGTGDDQLFGNLGNDTIVGGGGSDSIYGGQGDDVLIADNGVADDEVLLSGGLGEDTIFAANSVSDNITIYGGNGGSDAADGDDTIVGSAQADLVYGNAGDDLIVTDAGDDTIFGGAGDDTIDGGADLNVATGGLGNDTFNATGNVAGSDDYTTVTDFTQGSDLISFGATPDSFATVLPGAQEIDTLAQLYTLYGSNLAANASVAVVVTSGDLAGTTFVLAETGNAQGSADAVIALTGFNGTLALTDFA